MRLPLVSAMTAAAAVAWLAPAIAAPAQSGRYEMSRVGDGILRFDTVTGAVAVCRKEAEQWRCEGVADPQLDLQREVDRLRKENDALRTALERDAERDAPASPEAADKRQDRLVPEAEPDMPGAETIDQMMAMFERMMRRFRDMVESYENREDAPDSARPEHRL